MASQALIKEFEDLLGKENVFSSEADRQSYSYDSAVLPPVVPAFALRPTTTEQLGICVKKLYDYGIPMTDGTPAACRQKNAAEFLAGRSPGVMAQYGQGLFGSQQHTKSLHPAPEEDESGVLQLVEWREEAPYG